MAQNQQNFVKFCKEMAQNPEEKRLKTRAQQCLNYHVKVGHIARGPCQVCGEVKAEAHHDDYSKPLEVIWLCRIHHARMHRKDEEIALPGTWLYKMLHPDE